MSKQRDQLLAMLDKLIAASIVGGRKVEAITITKKQLDLIVGPQIKAMTQDLTDKGYSRHAIKSRLNQIRFDEYQGVKIKTQ